MLWCMQKVIFALLNKDRFQYLHNVIFYLLITFYNYFYNLVRIISLLMEVLFNKLHKYINDFRSDVANI